MGELEGALAGAPLKIRIMKPTETVTPAPDQAPPLTPLTTLTFEGLEADESVGVCDVNGVCN